MSCLSHHPALLFERMYHLIALDETLGFEEFKALFEKNLSQFRHNECKVLLRLVGEYASSLSEVNELWLRFYEAKLNMYLGEHEKASVVFNELMRIPSVLPPMLFLKLHQHKGLLYSIKRNWDEAISSFQQAFAICICVFYQSY